MIQRRDGTSMRGQGGRYRHDLVNGRNARAASVTGKSSLGMRAIGNLQHGILGRRWPPIIIPTRLEHDARYVERRADGRKCRLFWVTFNVTGTFDRERLESQLLRTGLSFLARTDSADLSITQSGTFGGAINTLFDLSNAASNQPMTPATAHHRARTFRFVPRGTGMLGLLAYASRKRRVACTAHCPARRSRTNRVHGTLAPVSAADLARPIRSNEDRTQNGMVPGGVGRKPPHREPYLSLKGGIAIGIVIRGLGHGAT